MKCRSLKTTDTRAETQTQHTKSGTDRGESHAIPQDPRSPSGCLIIVSSVGLLVTQEAGIQPVAGATTSGGAADQDPVFDEAGDITQGRVL